MGEVYLPYPLRWRFLGEIWATVEIFTFLGEIWAPIELRRTLGDFDGHPNLAQTTPYFELYPKRAQIKGFAAGLPLKSLGRDLGTDRKYGDLAFHDNC